MAHPFKGICDWCILLRVMGCIRYTVYVSYAQKVRFTTIPKYGSYMYMRLHLVYMTIDLYIVYRFGSRSGSAGACISRPCPPRAACQEYLTTPPCPMRYDLSSLGITYSTYIASMLYDTVQGGVVGWIPGCVDFVFWHSSWWNTQIKVNPTK